jgi:hypothetical protein
MEALLLCFTSKFTAATAVNYNQCFTSKEIQKIVQDHTGEPILQKDINEYLSQNNYVYDLVDDNFVWLCNKA